MQKGIIRDLSSDTVLLYGRDPLSSDFAITSKHGRKAYVERYLNGLGVEVDAEDPPFNAYEQDDNNTWAAAYGNSHNNVTSTSH